MGRESQSGQISGASLPNGHTTTFLVLSGDVVVNGEGDAGEGDFAIFARAVNGITVKAKADAQLLAMDGQPIAEPGGWSRPVRNE